MNMYMIRISENPPATISIVSFSVAFVALEAAQRSGRSMKPHISALSKASRLLKSPDINSTRVLRYSVECQSRQCSSLQFCSATKAKSE